jgi:type II secretory pathway pseudopilin PulG
MKGQQEVLTPLLLTGILIAIVGSVYLWGLPLIQKNRDVAVLQQVEDFIINLNEKIKNVANAQGREEIKINIPVTLSFNSTEKSIIIEVNTKGTIYSVGRIYFVRNDNEFEGTWGKDDPGVIYVDTTDLDGEYLQKYTLKYRQLNAPNKIYKISLIGDDRTVGENHIIIIEY